MHKTRNLFGAKMAQKGFRVSDFALFLCANCYHIFLFCNRPFCAKKKIRNLPHEHYDFKFSLGTTMDNIILSLRVGEILGLQPGDIDFDAADGRGTISVNKALQRADKVALSKIDPTQIYHTFPDRREGSKSSLILKKTKTKKSNHILYMTKPLKEELLAWLEKLKQDEQSAPEKYNNCGQLFRLPDGLPIAPDVLTKWYRMWRAEHPEFEKIVFHGLRHSSATYQLLQSGGDFKSVQGNTGHATATVLMDTYAHTQDKPRLELTEKIEADFYTQDVAGAKPQEPPENKTPVATKITGKMILEAIRQMDAEERRELTRVLFA